MPEEVTYYAIVDDLSTRENPAGVLRRIKHASGQRDEAFARDGQWSPTALLYSAERGNLDNKLYEITAAEAQEIVARIKGAE